MTMQGRCGTGVVLGLVAVLLGGCVSNNAQGGAGVGALAGGLVGSLVGPGKNRVENAAIGALIGGVLGYGIGNEMDKADRARLNDVYERAPSNQTTRWTNPDTGNAYEVVPQPAYNRQNRVCRDAQINAVIDGRVETVTSTACRQPDGRWELI
ncbi:MAG: glycine zipper domain-containing protein [Magnetococcus sp. WYHC-3]